MTDSPAGSDPERTTVPLRFPGGRLRHDHWTGLAALAASVRGDVRLESGGAVRIIGPDRAPVETTPDDLAASGLPGQLRHPRARAILSSPLAGRLDGHHGLGELPERLAEALLGSGGVDALHGRVRFGLDDGSGDVLAHSPDLAVVVDVPEGGARVHVAGRATSVRVRTVDAATVLVDTAVRFAGSAGPVRVPAAGSLHDLVVDAVAAHPLTERVTDPPHGSPTTAVGAPRVGWVDTTDGLVSLLAVVPDGIVPARLAEFLGAVERPSTITADGVIGLHELTEGMAEQVVRVLAPMGMVFDAQSPWLARATADER